MHGTFAHGRAPAGRRVRRHGAVECAGHPRRARHRNAAGLRQHRGAQGVGALPCRASPDRRCLRRSRLSGRRRQLHRALGRRCARRRRSADRAPRGEARELHRLEPRRPHHRRAVGQAPEALPARTGRQGAAAGARRCRSRRSRRRCGLRRIHASGTDLHVHRAHHRRRQDPRRVHAALHRQGRRRCRWAIRPRASSRSAPAWTRRPSIT